MPFRPLSRAALSAALALAVAGCAIPLPSPSGSAGPGASAPPASVGPGPAGRLVVGLSAESESMDPHLVYQSAGLSIVNAMFDTLVTILPDGSQERGLAREWTFVDPATLELALEGGVAFHDGTPFDAQSVKFSLERIIDPTTGSDFKNDLGAVESVEVVDALLVRIHFSRPDAAILTALGRIAMIPTTFRAGLPVGTGPFVFVERVTDGHTTIRANLRYWDSPRGKPLVGEVVFRPIPDVTARIGELTTGGVQIIADLPLDQVAAVETAGARAVSMEDGRHTDVWLTADGKGDVAENPGDQATAIEALTKPEVRVALNMAIDRQAIIDTLLGGVGAPSTNLFVPGDIGFDPAIPAYPHDPDAATTMLADAGYPDGFDVQFDLCTCDRADIAEAIAGELAKVGVRATIAPAEISQFNAKWGAGQNPMRMARLGFNDPNTYLFLWIRTGSPLGRYSNPALDPLIDQQAADLDAAKRVATLKRIAAMSHEDPPAIFLWSAPSVYGVAAGLRWEPHRLGYIPVVNTAVGG
jgi:peptide/nickel transport system substrate-binding protein